MHVIAEQCTGRGADGVVCAAAPLAAQAGAAVLRDGGNAFDAVVAAALAETVLLPSKCGLAGDLIAIAARAGSAVPERVARDRRGACRSRRRWRRAGGGATRARSRSAHPARPRGISRLPRWRTTRSTVWPMPPSASPRAASRGLGSTIGSRSRASPCCGGGTRTAPSTSPATSRSQRASWCASRAWLRPCRASWNVARSSWPVRSGTRSSPPSPRTAAS